MGRFSPAAVNIMQLSCNEVAGYPTRCKVKFKYLSAYLANFEVSAKAKGDKVIVKEVKGKEKRFIKGMRTHLYPPGMNIYRHSKGIKMPPKMVMPYKAALKLVEGHTKTFEFESKIEKDGFNATYWREYYNKKRRKTDNVE